MTVPRQGEIWWAKAENKRRPVLIVTRSEAVPVLSHVLIAPVSRTVRRIPTEVSLGAEQGLKVECAAAFDNLQPIRRSYLTERIGALTGLAQAEICRALAAMSDC